MVIIHTKGHKEVVWANSSPVTGLGGIHCMIFIFVISEGILWIDQYDRCFSNGPSHEVNLLLDVQGERHCGHGEEDVGWDRQERCGGNPNLSAARESGEWWVVPFFLYNKTFLLRVGQLCKPRIPWFSGRQLQATVSWCHGRRLEGRNSRGDSFIYLNRTLTK